MTSALSVLLDDACGEALAFADPLDGGGPESCKRPTPCTGWTVADLAEHVATGAFRDAEAFHRARLGTLSPPAEIALDHAEYAAALRLALDHLRSAVTQEPPRWPVVPTPFGRYPAEAAMQSLVLEFGVHRNDLEAALGGGAVPFSEPTRRAVLGFGSYYLLRQAAPLDEKPLTLQLRAESADMSVTWTGDAWIAGGAADRRCRISGSDDDIVRLMLRRCAIEADDFTLEDPHKMHTLFDRAIRPL